MSPNVMRSTAKRLYEITSFLRRRPVSERGRSVSTVPRVLALKGILAKSEPPAPVTAKHFLAPQPGDRPRAAFRVSTI
jgi:hypothetical protein